MTFQRLAEGGNIALGAGEGRGYIEVCDGLSVRGWKVSHGHCTKHSTGLHMHRGSFSAPTLPTTTPGTMPVGSADPHVGQHPLAAATMNGIGGTPGRREDSRRSMSISAMSQPGTPAQTCEECVIDSTAFFIRTTSCTTESSEKEILIFGDVEPDSVSLNPRTARVWAEAAPKIAQGFLKAVFIECSYDDTQDDAVLFGHLAPRHLVKELATLAQIVKTCQAEIALGRPTIAPTTTPSLIAQGDGDLTRKRKRLSTEQIYSPAARVGFEPPVPDGGRRSRSRGRGGGTTRTSAREKSKDNMGKDQHEDNYFSGVAPHPEKADASPGTPPLVGLTVVVIHVKDTLRDGPLVGESILRQLKEHEARYASEGQPLGCEFVISKTGGSYSF